MPQSGHREREAAGLGNGLRRGQNATLKPRTKRVVQPVLKLTSTFGFGKPGDATQDFGEGNDAYEKLVIVNCFEPAGDFGGRPLQIDGPQGLSIARKLDVQTLERRLGKELKEALSSCGPGGRSGWRGGSFSLQSIESFFNQFIEVVKVAALNLLPDALIEFRPMDFNVHPAGSFNLLLSGYAKSTFGSNMCSQLRRANRTIMTRVFPKSGFLSKTLVCAGVISAITGGVPDSNAQQAANAAAAPEFEVASVKPGALAKAGGEGSRRESIEHSPGTLTMRNVSLASALQWAYGLKEYQVLGPDWRFSERFDIAAKASGQPSVLAMKQMLQKLLAERFQLTSHREKREMPVYWLTVGKNRPRLTKSRGAGEAEMRIVDGSFVFEHTSMADLADRLSVLRVLEGRPVWDKTGIAGTFDFRLRFGDDATEMRRAMAEADGPSIFTVLQQQTGLRLESGKGMIEVLVIDRANRLPSAN